MLNKYLFFLITLITLVSLTTNKYYSLQAEYLEVPIQIAPKHTSIIEDLEPQFIWNAVDGANYYGFQATTDVTFLNINNTSDLDRGFLTDTTYIGEIKLLPDTLYFWRVCAKTLDATGEWSNIRYFKTPKNDGIFSEFKNQIKTKISPNPANEIANIQFENIMNFSFRASSISLYLFDVSGILITSIAAPNFSYNSNKFCFTLDCKNLQTGTYTIFLIGEKSNILAIEKLYVIR